MVQTQTAEAQDISSTICKKVKKLQAILVYLIHDADSTQKQGGYKQYEEFLLPATFL
jgi:hypothetical protein